MNDLFQKRLVELFFPFEQISEICSREKSIRPGHISTLQMWWARRPLAICRSAIFASLCPSPDEIAASPKLNNLLENIIPGSASIEDKLNTFIVKLSCWETTQDQELLKLANQILIEKHNETPLIIDTFAGGGSFPIEALRLGLDASASDLNPVAVTGLKLAIKYLPSTNNKIVKKYQELATLVSTQIDKATAHLYQDNTNEKALAFFWCRTYICPNCFIEVPLLQNYWLARGKEKIAVCLNVDKNVNKFNYSIIRPNTPEEIKHVTKGTVGQSSAICPSCLHKVSMQWLRNQGSKKAISDKLYAKLILNSEGKKVYTVTNFDDEHLAFNCRLREIEKRKQLSLPRALFDKNGIRHTWMIQYGIENTSDLYGHRQGIALLEVFHELEKIKQALLETKRNEEETIPLIILLLLTFNRLVMYGTKHAWWQSNGEFPANMFVRQAISMVWNYVEIPVNSPGASGWNSAIKWISKVAEHLSHLPKQGDVWQGDAAKCILPNSVADLVTIDPPYYDSIAYSYLSDTFYVWMKEFLQDLFPKEFEGELSPKKEEAIVDRFHRLAPSPKTDQHFREKMINSCIEANRILKPDGRLIVMFGHKKFEAWDAILSAITDAGFRLTASWPIHTERKSKFRHGYIDALSSSCLMVCIPEKNISKQEVNWSEFEKILRLTLSKSISDFQSAFLFGADLLVSLIAPACSLFTSYKVFEDNTKDVVSIGQLIKRLPDIASTCELESLMTHPSLQNYPEILELIIILKNKSLKKIDQIPTWFELKNTHSLLKKAFDYAVNLNEGDTLIADKIWESLLFSEQELICCFMRISAILSLDNSLERRLAYAALGRISLKVRA